LLLSAVENNIEVHQTLPNLFRNIQKNGRPDMAHPACIPFMQIMKRKTIEQSFTSMPPYRLHVFIARHGTSQ
jgi:hypothetical protein